MTDKKDNVVQLGFVKANIGLEEIELPVSMPLDELHVSNPTLAIAAENLIEYKNRYQPHAGGFTVLAEPRYLNFICADYCKATLMCVIVKENNVGHDAPPFVRFDLEFSPPDTQPHMTFPGGIKKDVKIWSYAKLLKSGLGGEDAITAEKIVVKLLGDYLKWILSNNIVKNEKDLATAKPGETNELHLRCGRYTLASDIEMYVQAVNCRDVPQRVMNMLENFASELDKKDTDIGSSSDCRYDLTKELESLYKMIDRISELMGDVNDLTKIFYYV